MRRFERRPVRVAYQWVDPLGYLFCHDCTPPENRPDLVRVGVCEGDHCEGCHRLISSVTAETSAMVEIEYVRCRIF